MCRHVDEFTETHGVWYRTSKNLSANTSNEYEQEKSFFLFCFSLDYVFLCSYANGTHVVFQKKNQGLIMVNLHNNFVSCNNEANISHVAGEAPVLFGVFFFFFFFNCKLEYCFSYNVDDSLFTDHFDHIKKVIGAESIGIGGDFEGAKRWEIFISQHNVQCKSHTRLHNCTLLTLL